MVRCPAITMILRSGASMKIWTDRAKISGFQEKVRRIDFTDAHDMYSSLDRAIRREGKDLSTAMSYGESGVRSCCSATGQIRESSDPRKDDFQGCSIAEYNERRYKWSGGLDKVRRLSELDAMVSAARCEKRWSDYDGDNMDVERYYNEQPFLSRRVQVSGGNRRGQYRIVVNVAENYRVNSENMLWKAYAASRLCDEIESQGNRVEVIVGGFASGCAEGYGYTWVNCVAKKAQDPVNLGLLCTLMAPWTWRITMFALLYHYEKCSPYIGRSHTVREYLGGDEIENKAILIDTGDCLSHERADVFIRTLDIGTEYEVTMN